MVDKEGGMKNYAEDIVSGTLLCAACFERERKKKIPCKACDVAAIGTSCAVCNDAAEWRAVWFTDGKWE